MTIHIYTAALQPATRFDVMAGIGDPLWVTTPGNRLVWARCCRQRRPAKNCGVRVYYDATDSWCLEGKGCKNPKLIAAEKRAKFARRSAGQRKRFGQRYAPASRT